VVVTTTGTVTVTGTLLVTTAVDVTVFVTETVEVEVLVVVTPPLQRNKSATVPHGGSVIAYPPVAAAKMIKLK